jgi:DNA mismatch repair protein MutL
MEHGMMPSAAGVAAANEALAAARAPQSQFPLHDLNVPFPASGIEASPGTALVPSASGSLYDSQVGGVQAYPDALGATAVPGGGPQPFADLLEGLRVVGQVMDTFIVAETARGLVVIDQHVAHERVLYEYLCGLKGSTAIEKQALLVPQTLELDRRSAVLLRERLDEVVRVGFDIEPFGGESYVVRAVPAAIKNKDPLRVLRDLVDELVEATVTRRLVPTREQIWITSACKMAVKAGDPLSHAEMERLIVDLAQTENPYLCPHGRPITVTLSKESLMRMFKRA